MRDRHPVKDAQTGEMKTCLFALVLILLAACSPRYSIVMVKTGKEGIAVLD